MNQVIQKFEQYIYDTLAISVKPVKFQADNMPAFLREFYTFYQISLLNVPLLVMVSQTESEQTPSTVHKHVTLVHEKWGKPVIYLHPRVSTYNRKRLIEYKVPFVVPGNQLYLPPLGLDLREHFKRIRSTVPVLSPSAQAAILYVLRHGKQKAFTPTSLAKYLGYSTMSMTRAFNELETANLGKVTSEGRERIIRFHEEKKTLWEKSQNFLNSPVKQRLHIRPLVDNPFKIVSGLMALAQYSMLAPPLNPVYAVYSQDWKALQLQAEIIKLTMPESSPPSWEVEIWNYSPNIFAENNIADRFSLYLSLRQIDDERVESALQKMIEAVLW